MTARHSGEASPLWLVGSGRPRPLPKTCALCAVPPASALGLCRGHLEQAAAELARMSPRPTDPDDGRPSSTPFRALCRRCGSSRHDTAGCPA